MKKTTFFFFFLFTSIFYGQLSNYSFSESVEAYTPVSSPTTVLNGGVDSGASALTNIGFDFIFDGTTYTQFSAASNGYIRLGAVGPSSTNTPISSTGAGPAIVFFARDGKTNEAVVYELIGAAPNRILTIEYPNYFVHWSSTTNTLSAQIKLYEGSNTIEVVYGTSNRATSYTGQVGIVGSSTSNYSNRTTATDWSSTTAGTSNSNTMTWSSTVGPIEGLTYIWSLPSCLPPSNLSSTGVTTSEATLSWTASTSTPSNNYEVYWSTANTAPDATTTPSALNVTSSYLATGLSASTTYYWWVRSNCGGGDLSTWANGGSFITACEAEIAPTNIQNFDTFNGSAPSPICWSEATGVLAAPSILTAVDSQWKLKTNGFANITSSNKAASINLDNNKKDWLISNSIDLGATAGAFQLRYKYAVTGYNSTSSTSTLGTHNVSVVISTDGGQTWSNTNVIKAYTGTRTYSNTGVDEIIPLTAFSGVVKIAFVATTNTTSPDLDFHVDDFIIEANTLGLDNVSSVSNAVVYVQNNQIVISTGLQTMTDVTVYDLQGRKLISKSLINSSNLVLENISVANQIVLVEIVTENGKVTKKVKL